MVHFFYHMDYLEVETAKIKAEPAATTPFKDYTLDDGILIDHARIYVMGDKYGIPGLKALAKSKFEDILKFTCAGLVKAMRIAYVSTVDEDKGLRQLIVNKLHAYNIATSLGKPEIDENVKDLPELGYALLRKQLNLAMWDGTGDKLSFLGGLVSITGSRLSRGYKQVCLKDFRLSSIQMVGGATNGMKWIEVTAVLRYQDVPFTNEINNVSLSNLCFITRLPLLCNTFVATATPMDQRPGTESQSAGFLSEVDPSLIGV